jgi:hypothetical protein
MEWTRRRGALIHFKGSIRGNSEQRGASPTGGGFWFLEFLKNDKVELNISTSNVSVKTSSRGWGRVKCGRKDIGRHGREIAGCLEPGLCLNTHPLELK